MVIITIEKIIKLGDLGEKYLQINDEIDNLLKEAELLRQEVILQLKASKRLEIFDDSRDVHIKLERKEIEKFISKDFKKAEPAKYEQYRIPSKTFKQAKLKSEDPDTYKKYLSKEVSENLIIERIEKDFSEVLDEL